MQRTSLGFSAFAHRYLRNQFFFFSSDYLDVSVHQLTIPTKCRDHPAYAGRGYPIRKPPVDNACWRAYRRYRTRTYVLPRLKLPEHPPLT